MLIIRIWEQYKQTERTLQFKCIVSTTTTEMRAKKRALHRMLNNYFVCLAANLWHPDALKNYILFNWIQTILNVFPIPPCTSDSLWLSEDIVAIARKIYDAISSEKCTLFVHSRSPFSAWDHSFNANCHLLELGTRSKTVSSDFQGLFCAEMRADNVFFVKNVFVLRFSILNPDCLWTFLKKSSFSSELRTFISNQHICATSNAQPNNFIH